MFISIILQCKISEIMSNNSNKNLPITNRIGNQLIHKRILERRPARVVTHDKQEDVTQLYVAVKSILKSCIFEAIDTNYFHPNDTMLVIDLGDIDHSNPPYLDITRGKQDSDGWSIERTIRQYIFGTSYAKGNIPKTIMCQTIKYTHTDDDVNEINEIQNEQVFHPIIPDKIIFQKNPEWYVQLSKIFPNDTNFLKEINNKLRRLNPNYYAKVVHIQGNEDTININEHPVKLSREYYKLVLCCDTDSSNGTTHVATTNLSDIKTTITDV